jgi:hypothetical protein
MTKTDLRDDTTPGAIRSERWAASDWNDARMRVGIPGRDRRNTHSKCRSEHVQLELAAPSAADRPLGKMQFFGGIYEKYED